MSGPVRLVEEPTNRKELPVEAKQTAIEVLVAIAEDTEIDTGHRIAAACAILDRLDRIEEKDRAAA